MDANLLIIIIKIRLKVWVKYTYGAVVFTGIPSSMSLENLISFSAHSSYEWSSRGNAREPHVD